MSIKPRIFHTFASRLSELAHGTDTYRCLPTALAFDSLKPKELENLRIQKLRRLLAVAWERSAFYHERMRRAHLHPQDVHNIFDLKRLEPTRKSDVREAMARGLILTQPNRWLLKSRTSGSTGHPLVHYHSRSPSYGAACQLRAYMWYGWSPGDTIATSHPEFHRSSLMRAIRNVENNLVGRITLQRDPFNDEIISRYLHILDRVRPTVFENAPSVLCEFARVGRSRNISIHGPRVIVTSNEVLLPHQREEISSYFQAEVFDLYGSSEVNSIAFECPTHKGLHVAADHVILEDDPDAGVVLTDLDNSTMPFIRYAIGDAAVFHTEPCVCGRASPLISHILGRRAEVIRGPNGNRVFSQFFSNNLLEQHWIERYGLSQFQVVQERLDFIRVRAIVTKRPSGRDEELFTNEVRNSLGDVEISYEYVSDIPVGAGGKRHFVASNFTSQTERRTT
jgi:phenylacetate-CoA ligase